MKNRIINDYLKLEMFYFIRFWNKVLDCVVISGDLVVVFSIGDILGLVYSVCGLKFEVYIKLEDFVEEI